MSKGSELADDLYTLYVCFKVRHTLEACSHVTHSFELLIVMILFNCSVICHAVCVDVCLRLYLFVPPLHFPSYLLCSLRFFFSIIPINTSALCHSPPPIHLSLCNHSLFLSLPMPLPCPTPSSVGSILRICPTDTAPCRFWFLPERSHQELRRFGIRKVCLLGD